MHEEAAAMPEKTDEYALLKTEILQNIQTIDNARNILYMAVGAILTFAFMQSEPFEALIFIVPYVVIIPMYLVTFENLYGLYRIGTYLMVFCEGTDYFWETRLYKLFDVIKPKKKLRYSFVLHTPFVLTGLICSVLSVFFLCKNHYRTDSFDFIFRLGLSIVLFIVVVIITYIHRKATKSKEIMIGQWTKVKESEAEAPNDAVGQ